MRILALVTEAYGGTGGIAQFNRDLFDAWAESPDVEALAVLPRLARGRAAAPAKVRQEPPVFERLAYAAKVFGTVGKGPFDLIFCGHLYLAPLARLAAARCRAPYWIQVHGIEAWNRPGRLARAAFDSASLVTAVSRFTRSRVLGWSRLAPEKIKVLPDTVDARFTPGPKQSSLVSRFGLEGKKTILTVGRLHPDERYKGQDAVIAAMPEVLKREPRAAYVVAGEGGDRPRLERAARDAGVAANVVFTGRVDDALMPDLYRMADVFAMPSSGEGFGIVFLEAASCGVPAIGGDRDGSRDALRDGRLGTLVDPTNRAALAAALVGALAAPRPEGLDREAAAFGKSSFGAHARALLAKFSHSARDNDKKGEHA